MFLWFWDAEAPDNETQSYTFNMASAVRQVNEGRDDTGALGRKRQKKRTRNLLLHIRRCEV